MQCLLGCAGWQGGSRGKLGPQGWAGVRGTDPGARQLRLETLLCWCLLCVNWVSLSVLGECKILDRGIPGGSGVKNLLAIQEIQETRVQSLGWEGTLEKKMAIHSSILAWRIPRTASLAGYSPWDCKESDTIEVTEHAHT